MVKRVYGSVMLLLVEGKRLKWIRQFALAFGEGQPQDTKVIGSRGGWCILLGWVRSNESAHARQVGIARDYRAPRVQ